MSIMTTQVMGFIRELQKSYGAERSPKWREVAKSHLKCNPLCAVCAAKSGLNVHHIQPFHLHPELELEPTNLVTLCLEDHILFGHLNNWKSFNPMVIEDCQEWEDKILRRPK